MDDPRKWFSWLLTLIWAAVIFFLSTEAFNSDWTSSLFVKCLNALQIHLPPDLLRSLHTALRKLAHATEYAVLAFLLYQSLNWREQRRWMPNYAIWCILAAGMYSLFDELHQSLVPGRTPSLMDSGIDTLGAALAMAFVYLRAAPFANRN